MKSKIFTATINAAVDAIVVIDSDNKVIVANPSTLAVTGWTPDELIGQSILTIIPEQYRDRHTAGIVRFLKTKVGHVLGKPFVRLPVLRKDGSEVITHISIAHFRQGGKDFFTGMIRDVTELVKYEEHREGLLNELNHRVKNMMAIILSVIGQTAKPTSSVLQFRDELHDRVTAMGRTHDLLVDRLWGVVTFEELLEVILDHLGRPWDYSGLPIELKPSAAINIAMIIHELATNALKYGAWSTNGTVCLEAEVNGKVVDIVWRETGGPVVVVPVQHGFGTKLLRRAVGGAPGSSINVEYKPEGVRAVIKMPMSLQVQFTNPTAIPSLTN